MAETLLPEASSSLPGFAELIASLAALKETVPGDDHLADDVATLSYESALRTHGRYRATGRTALHPGFAKAGSAEAGSFEAGSSKAGSVRAESVSLSSGSTRPRRAARRQPASGGLLEPPATALERERKCASITVRMSPEECSQLRERASEAGLTVSAYLRSCAFEVESLRAQVKQTLLELRSTNSAAREAEAFRRTRRRWLPQNWASRTWSRISPRNWFHRIGSTRRNPATDLREAVSA